MVQKLDVGLLSHVANEELKLNILILLIMVPSQNLVFPPHASIRINMALLCLFLFILPGIHVFGNWETDGYAKLVQRFNHTHDKGRVSDTKLRYPL